MTSNHFSIRWSAGLVAAASAALLVLGMLGDWMPRLDALAAFRWHAGALFALAGMAVLWRRLAIGLAAVAAPIILGVPVLATHWGARPTTVAATEAASRFVPTAATAAIPAPPPRRSLRVLSFNTWDHARNVDAVYAMLRQADADVIVLAEISPPKRALLDLLRPHYPHQVHCAAFWPCSMALVSRLPLVEHAAVLPSITRPASVWARIAGEDEGLTIIGVHVVRPTRSTSFHRGQMQGLTEMVRAAKGAVIVAGDFNTPSWAVSMQHLRDGTGLQAMPRILPSWPAWPVSLPQFPIDHILVAPPLRLESVTTGTAAGSDHLPIIGTVVMAKALYP